MDMLYFSNRQLFKRMPSFKAGYTSFYSINHFVPYFFCEKRMSCSHLFCLCFVSAATFGEQDSIRRKEKGVRMF